MTSSDAIIASIKAIPHGRVASYAQVAVAAGIPNGARLVARILHSCSGKHDLPWWRVIRSSGEIALPEDRGGNQQKELLLREGVRFSGKRTVGRDCFVR